MIWHHWKGWLCWLACDFWCCCCGWGQNTWWKCFWAYFSFSLALYTLFWVLHEKSGPKMKKYNHSCFWLNQKSFIFRGWNMCFFLLEHFRDLNTQRKLMICFSLGIGVSAKFIDKYLQIDWLKNEFDKK